MPETLYDLFHGLAAAEIDYLLTGAVALTLHGVPRLTYDVDLLAAPGGDGEKARALFASWGYGERPAEETAAAPGTRVVRLAHPTAPIAEIDLPPLPLEVYAALRGRATVFNLIDTPIPTVSRADLLRFKAAAPRAQDREDAAGLRLLDAVLRGDEGDDGSDPRRIQIEKFRRWHTENRCEWLLAAMRLRRGLPPEPEPPRNIRLRRVNPWRGR